MIVTKKKIKKLELRCTDFIMRKPKMLGSKFRDSGKRITAKLNVNIMNQNSEPGKGGSLQKHVGFQMRRVSTNSPDISVPHMKENPSSLPQN